MGTCGCWGRGHKEFGAKIKKSNVALDAFHLGPEAVIVKSGLRLCGSGVALANAPLVQNKSCWEVTVQAQGTWGLGVAHRKIDLGSVLLGKSPGSWVLRSTGKLMSSDVLYGETLHKFVEGDIITVTYNHDALSFFINGALMSAIFTTVRGEVYPAVYVSEGAILDLEFANFTHPVANFGEILIERTVL